MIILSCVFTGFLLPIVYVILTHYEQYLCAAIKTALPSVLFPASVRAIRRDDLVVPLVLDFAYILVFGIPSPVTAFALCMKIIAVAQFNRVVIGRCVSWYFNNLVKPSMSPTVWRPLSLGNKQENSHNKQENSHNKQENSHNKQENSHNIGTETVNPISNLNSHPLSSSGFPTSATAGVALNDAVQRIQNALETSCTGTNGYSAVMFAM